MWIGLDGMGLDIYQGPFQEHLMVLIILAKGGPAGFRNTMVQHLNNFEMKVTIIVKLCFFTSFDPLAIFLI